MDHSAHPEEAQGQATYEMANLRPDTMGLLFVVWISQCAGARHDVRVKVAHCPRLKSPSDLGTYAVRPFRHVEGPALSSADEDLLRRWVELNRQVLIDFWDGRIEYTEDVLRVLKPV
jgi:hypothetical protein